MTGYTPRHSLPYAQDADILSSWPATNQDLATKLDSLVHHPYLSVWDGSAVSIPSGVWTRLNLSSIYASGGGGGLAQSGGGISVESTAVYTLYAFVDWASSSAGGRLLGIGDTGGSAPNSFLRNAATPNTAAGGFPMSAVWSLALAGPGSYSLYVWQSSGAALSTSFKYFGVSLTAL